MSTKQNLDQHDDDEVALTIAENAYYKAEKRGFEPGFEEQDWIESERDVITLTASRLWSF